MLSVRGMFNRKLVGCLIAFMLAACEPEATPLPVDIVPTTPAIPTQATAQPVRYAIDASLFSVMLPEQVESIAASGEIESVTPPFLDDDLGNRYDVLIALGSLPDATDSPTLLTISLGLNTALAPLDDAAIAEVVRRAIRTDGIAAALGIAGVEALPHVSETAQTLRTSLANAGLPDGFDLSMASLYATGADVIAEQLAVIGIETRVTPMNTDEANDLGAYHLILFGSYAQPLVTNVDGVEIIDLLRVPISVRTVPDLTIEFTDDGLPLVQR